MPRILPLLGRWSSLTGSGLLDFDIGTTPIREVSLVRNILVTQTKILSLRRSGTAHCPESRRWHLCCSVRVLSRPVCDAVARCIVAVVASRQRTLGRGTRLCPTRLHNSECSPLPVVLVEQLSINERWVFPPLRTYLIPARRVSFHRR